MGKRSHQKRPTEPTLTTMVQFVRAHNRRNQWPKVISRCTTSAPAAPIGAAFFDSASGRCCSDLAHSFPFPRRNKRALPDRPAGADHPYPNGLRKMDREWVTDGLPT